MNLRYFNWNICLKNELIFTDTAAYDLYWYRFSLCGFLLLLMLEINKIPNLMFKLQFIYDKDTTNISYLYLTFQCCWLLFD